MPTARCQRPVTLPRRDRKRSCGFDQLACGRPAVADDALLHVGLQHAEGLLVPLHGHVQGLQHPLGREVVGDDPLLHFDRLGRHAERLRVEAEVENQLFGRAGDAAKIRVQADGVLVVDFDPLARCICS